MEAWFWYRGSGELDGKPEEERLEVEERDRREGWNDERLRGYECSRGWWSRSIARLESVNLTVSNNKGNLGMRPVEPNGTSSYFCLSYALREITFATWLRQRELPRIVDVTRGISMSSRHDSKEDSRLLLMSPREIISSRNRSLVFSVECTWPQRRGKKFAAVESRKDRVPRAVLCAPGTVPFPEGRG